MNWFRDDPALQARMSRHLPPEIAKEAEAHLGRWGHLAAARVDRLARLADRHRPILHRYDAHGDRVDEIEYHPSYLEIRRIAVENGLVAAGHESFGPLPRTPRSLVFAAGYLFGQAECGYYCPVAMTDALARVLVAHAPRDLAEVFVTRLASRDPAQAFEGAMFLTEKGGGSDLGATATTARRTGDGQWKISGAKWFCSNATADLILTLARPDGAAGGTRGLGLFLIPRVREDGARNGFRIERLKDKLGVTSMPTGEFVFEDADAWMLAPPGEGLHGMADMMNVCRLHNAVASVAIARRAFRESLTHARARVAFEKPVDAHPLQRVVLAGLAVDTEGAVAGVLESGDLMDRADAGDAEAARALRALTPIAKSATARLAVDAASAACEALGGNGFIEDFVTPRLLRDAQVLPIWEGTTNILALDLLRGHQKEDAATALVAEAGRALESAPSGLAEVVDAARQGLSGAVDALNAPREERLVRVGSSLFHAWCASLLLRDARSERARIVARAFVARHLDERVAPPDFEGYAVANYHLLVDGALPRE